jgi:hypothetical protein
MALHRDIYWVGRQWAVTGYGMQAIDQRLKGKFDIETARLWEDGLLESMHAREWVNIEDFNKGLSVARTHFPAPPGKAASALVAPPPPRDSVTRTDKPAENPEHPLPADFVMRAENCRAKFLSTWRVHVPWR